MRIIIISIALLLCACPIKASETYYEFERIAYVEALADRDTLVVFDVGNTLIEGGTSWGHARSFGHAILQAAKRGEDPKKFMQIFAPQWIEAQRYCPPRLVDPTIPLLVRRLQNRGIRVMALTHRPVETAGTTLDQLNAVGIDFELTAPYAEQMEIPLGSGVKYIEGVLFATYYNHKGWTLAEFIARAGILPGKIVIVDDRRDKLEEVVTSLSYIGFCVKGVHYQVPDSLAYPWDAEVCAIQKKWMGSVIGDAEAKALLDFHGLAY